MRTSSITWVSTLLVSTPAVAFTPQEIFQAAQVARQIDIVGTIADDTYTGRDNDTAGSLAIQQVLIDEISQWADGLNTAETGDDAYKQPFSTTEVGTNIVAVIPGGDLADEYVMVGAHYDHLGQSGPDIFNGATDNAAGVAVALAIAAAIDSLPSAPRRSVIFALWDAEEDGLVGSEAYVSSPLVALGDIVAYVNLDIQGANLLPALRTTSFAIGAESGGSVLQALVEGAIDQESVDTHLLSRQFGQDRSDHANFMDNGVPSVFFSDGTGPCYHTPQDDIAVVDLHKLRDQSQVAFRVTLALAEAATPPPFVATSLLTNTFEDAVVIGDVLDAGLLNISLFTSSQAAALLNARQTVLTIVGEGAGAYDASDQLAVAQAALSALSTLEELECDGYLLSPVPAQRPPGVAVLASLLGVAGLLLLRRTRGAVA